MNFFKNLGYIISILSILVPLKGIEKPKNIIFFMADDVGMGDLSYYHRIRTGEDPIVETPNIDALFERGVRFSQAYTASALCAPTRYAVATGRYPTRSITTMGDWTFTKKSSIDSTTKTIGHVAQEAGYKTAVFGKYSLGGTFYQINSEQTYTGGDYYTGFTCTPEQRPDITRGFKSDLPAEKGFDYSFIVPSGHQAPPHAFFENGQWSKIHSNSEIVNLVVDPAYNSTRDKNVLVPSGSMLGDRGTKKGGPGPENHGLGDSHWDSRNIGVQTLDKALSFIDRNKSQPFFMYYCALAVHLPFTPPNTWRGEPLAGTTPHLFLDMVKELDLQVGELIEKLKTEGLYEDTLFVFTSDNGGLKVKGAMDLGHHGNNGERGAKCTATEGGFHVPFAAHWPRAIQPDTDSDVLLSTTDLMATLYHMDGRNIPEDQALDSFSFWPHLIGQKEALSREYLLSQGLFAGHWRARVVRKKDFKLILGEKKRSGGNMRNQFLKADYFPEGLFHLKTDPLEEKNLVKSPEFQNKNQDLHAVWTQYLEFTKNEQRSTPTQY